ncbi:MAG: AAA family ATPase [Candidatus Midichloria sp.]|nr:AAA family ATPase [Candidatus Midichloria sp.]
MIPCLNVGQKDAVVLALSTTDKIIGIQGGAGTGKTAILNQIKALSATRGYQLFDIAPTRSATNTLFTSTGIESKTLQLLLAKYAGIIAGRGTKGALERMRVKKIVVLYEASLASTEQIQGLIKLSSKLDFRLVMLGDSKQLGSVTAGKPFYYLQEHGMSTVTVGTVVRQENNKLLKSIYQVEEVIDQGKSRAAKGIYESLKSIGSNNVIDLSVIYQNELITNQKLATSAYQKWPSASK